MSKNHNKKLKDKSWLACLKDFKNNKNKDKNMNYGKNTVSGLKNRKIKIIPKNIWII